MKKSLIIAVLMALAMSGMAQEVHYDFSAPNSTGYEIYYLITDAQNHWVEATYPCQNGDNYWWGFDKPEGKLILSETVAFNGTDYTLVAIGDHAFCGCTDLRGVLELPQTINTIGEGAFKGCSNISGDLNIPAPVEYIGNEAFSGCLGLSGNLSLPDSLQYVGSLAFFNCSNFNGQLIVPSHVTHIGDRAFENCSFTNMAILPASLTFIGEWAFKGCSTIASINIKATVPPVTASTAFDDMPVGISVFVPYQAKEAYQNATGWSRFGNNINEKSFWDGKATSWTKGTGTEENPYLIESAENLAWLAQAVNERFDSFNDVKAYQDTCFKLVIDLDLQRNNLPWNPIGALHESDNGKYYTYFSGSFDGNGHTISNYGLTSNGGWFISDGIDVGLFASVSDAVISNLTVQNARIHSNRPEDRCGGIVGRAINSDISNCHFSGTITSDQNSPQWSSVGAAFGGIVGEAQSCRIEKSTSEIDLFGLENSLGGIAGVLLCNDSIGATTVFDCSTIGTVKEWHFQSSYKAYAGGIVGKCGNAEGKQGKIQIEHCHNKALIKGLGDTDAIGHVSPPMNQIVGGIVGFSSADTLSIQNCYSNQDIDIHETNTTNFAGGIIGCVESGSAIYVKNCYHVGEMTAYNRGGVLAQIGSMTIIRNCYFDAGCAPDDGFGLPLDKEYMKTEAFVNQLNNGSTVFRMDTEPYENDGYPIFGTDGLIFEGAEWYYEILNEDGSITYQHLQCMGDTTINGQRPKIIIRSNTQYDKDLHTKVTHEYVYEENGVVYWWNKLLGKFTVLYDFSAEVGDEWTIEVGDNTITTHVYDSELEYINGIPYKRLTIADPDNIFSNDLVSNIGHLTSFFPERLMTQGKNYRVEGMRCYWVDGELVFKPSDDDCDEIYLELHNGIEEGDPSTGSGAFMVYPNPAKGILFVRLPNPPDPLRRGNCDSPTMGKNEYRITNLMGQTLLQGRIDAENQQIDISVLPSGMYFITFAGETQKFVVR
jgi:hypothetical protein